MAQTKSVSNVGGSTQVIDLIDANQYIANSFTTGGMSTDRYKLNNVVVDLGTSCTATLSAGIYTDSSNDPGTSVASLTRSGSTERFTAPAHTTLHGATTYWLVVNSSNCQIESKTDDSETGDTGWSIGNAFKYRTGTTGAWTTIPDGRSLMFSITVGFPATVSNLSETAGLGHAPLTGFTATGFTTGGAGVDRYTLNNVEVAISDCTGGGPVVSIHSDNGGNRGTKIGSNLTRSGTSGTFTASDITLNGSTTYFLSVSSATTCVFGNTASDAQSSHPTGWTIADGSVHTGGTVTTSLRFTVNGTPAPTLSADKVTQTGARLTLGVHTAAWYYKSTQASASCSNQVSMGTTQVTLSSLTANTSYTYKAYSDSGCTTELTSTATDAHFTTLNLTASSVTQTGATLTIANYLGGSVTNWYYKANTGPDTSCSGAQTSASATLSGLTASTPYTYKAYSDSGCTTANELASRTFTTSTPSDTTPPTVSSLSPPDEATSVAVNSNLVMTFSENVQAGTGNIVIRRATNTDITIPVTGSQVTFNTTVVTINPSSNLLASTAYRVRMASGVIKDSANINFAGINNDTTWNFTTAAAPDTTAPTATGFNPADDAVGVALNANFTATFSENVQRDSSKYIRLWAAGDTRATGHPITVSVSGNRVTINPTGNLPANTDHSIHFQDGAIEDLASNDYTGHDNAATWNFTTGDAVQPPTDGEGGGADDDDEDPPTEGGGGADGAEDDEDDSPPVPKPGAPRSLRAESGVGEVRLSWDEPEDDGGAAITDYLYRINEQDQWISIGSAETTVRVTGLSIGAAYVFEVRAVTRNGAGPPSRVKAKAGAVLRFAHFANGAGITSALELVNAGSAPVRPAVYFYDTAGALLSAESVVEVTGELEVAEDGGLAVLTEIAPLGVLAVSTHGRGELLTGSLKVVTAAPVGAGLRFDLPQAGRGLVQAGRPLRDAIFPARRREGGLNTGVALQNLESSPGLLRCELLRGGVPLDASMISLEANGQTSWTLDQAFPATDTSDFTGSVRCTAAAGGSFSAVVLEADPAAPSFIPLPVFPVEPMTEPE